MTSSKPNDRSKTPPPNTITLEVRASTYELGGGWGGHNYLVHNIYQLPTLVAEGCPEDINFLALPGCTCIPLSMPRAAKQGEAGAGGEKLSAD